MLNTENYPDDYSRQLAYPKPVKQLIGNKKWCTIWKWIYGILNMVDYEKIYFYYADGFSVFVGWVQRGY